MVMAVKMYILTLHENTVVVSVKKQFGNVMNRLVQKLEISPMNIFRRRIKLPVQRDAYVRIKSAFDFHPNIHFLIHSTWCRVFSECDESYPKRTYESFMLREVKK